MNNEILNSVVYVDENDEVVGTRQEIVQRLIDDFIDELETIPTDKEFAQIEIDANQVFDDMLEVGVLTEQFVPCDLELS